MAELDALVTLRVHALLFRCYNCSPWIRPTDRVPGPRYVDVVQPNLVIKMRSLGNSGSRHSASISASCGIVEWAIAGGQRAAKYIDRYLKGEVLTGGPHAKSVKASDIKVEIPPDVQKMPRKKMRLLPPCERSENFREVALGFDRETAMSEAERCLNCAGSLCRDVCSYGAPQFGAEENAKMQKCNFCIHRWVENKLPICVAACPMTALDAGPIDEMRAKYGEAREALGFSYDEKVRPSIIFKPKA